MLSFVVARMMTNTLEHLARYVFLNPQQEVPFQIVVSIMAGKDGAAVQHDEPAQVPWSAPVGT